MKTPAAIVDTGSSKRRTGRSNPTTEQDADWQQLYQSILQYGANSYETALAGLPVSALQALQEWMGFTNKEIGEIMGMSESTMLRRYKDPDALLTREESDKLVDLMRVLTEGYQLYGHMSLFQQWLHTPLRVLNGKVPVSMLWSSTGRNRLREVFGQLGHGYTF